jgi:hypothetical protein
MKNCPICNFDSRPSDANCQNCGWPLGNLNTLPVQTEVVNWASAVYREVLRLQRTSGSGGYSTRGSSAMPSSSMNERILDPLPDSQPWKAELAKLQNQLQALEKNQRPIDMTPWAERHKQLDASIQRVDKLIMGQQEELKRRDEQYNNTFQQYHDALNSYKSKLSELVQVQTQQARELSLLQQQLAYPSKPTTPPTTSMTVAPSAIAPEQSAPPAHRLINSAAAYAVAESGLTREEAELIEEYNKSPQDTPLSLKSNAMTVSINEESFNRLRDGDDSNLNFRNDRKGNYLVVSRAGYHYLIPSKQRKVIGHIYTTTKAIYHCEGYSESQQTIHLIKPAIVTEESADCWRLTQKGTLQFT